MRATLDPAPSDESGRGAQHEAGGAGPGNDRDPIVTNPDLYQVVFENDRVRVLEYRDEPGDRTAVHHHPDSLMYTLSSFRRRLYGPGGQHEVELDADAVAWLPAQEHAGHNIGETPTRVIFVELKDSPPTAESPHEATLGPDLFEPAS